MTTPLEVPTPVRPEPSAAGPTLVAVPGGGRLDHAARAAPISAVVAHGEALARAGLRALLQASTVGEIRVLAMAASGDEVVAAARDLRPDVLIMDVDLPGCGAAGVMRQIRAEAEADGTRIGMLVLMGATGDSAVVDVLRAGALGLLGRDAAPDELMRALRTVASGDAVLGPSIAHGLIGAVLARPERLDPRPEELEELTDREREIMALVAWGLSNHEIAERLVISPATAKTHVSRAMLKLHVQDRAQLAVLAYQCGLVTAGDPAARTTAAHRIAGRALPAAA